MSDFNILHFSFLLSARYDPKWSKPLLIKIEMNTDYVLFIGIKYLLANNSVVNYIF